jgi:phage terminase large subunit-like protein
MEVAEIIDLASRDLLFYGQHYFPKTARQASPEFHVEIAEVLDSNLYEKIAAKVFRGGAKTSLARILISKRIAFAISRTILIVSETAEHSYETVKWIKRAVDRRDHWSRDFGLVAGNEYVNPETNERYTWRDDKIQIVCTHVKDVNDRPAVITIVGTGIFGQSRGLNIEDYRPDFILLDDIQDEDSANTAEQRKKVEERVYGAISNTLAPKSEAPTACMLMLQTPLHPQDVIEKAKLDSTWKYLEYSVFDSSGQSRWPERWSTAELLAKKAGFIARNQLSLWLREWEVRVTSNELAYFKSNWLVDNYWRSKSDLPEGMVCYMGADPTPPPKDTEQKSSQALAKLDNAAIVVIGVYRGHVYVLETYMTKSPIPTEFINKILELANKYNVRCIGFESLLFARTTKFYLEQQMFLTKSYYRILAIEDRRKKSIRIRDGLTDLSFSGQLHVHPDEQQLIAEYFSYPDVDHDDVLDALTMALMCRNPSDILEGEYEDVTDKDQELLEDWRGCPSVGYYE